MRVVPTTSAPPSPVTVLMPVWNAENYLQEALDSIWSQTYREFELLVVDDGSTDRSHEILAACKDPRLRILRNEKRLKLSGALNRGMHEARGELIARMDADDRMRPDRLAKQVALLQRVPDLVCCSGAVRTFGAGHHEIRKFPSGPSRIQAFSLFYAPFSHPAAMFRRKEMVAAALWYDGSYYPAEDYELWVRLLARYRANNLSDVLLDYRVHPDSMTGAEWSDMDLQTIRIQEKILTEALGLTPSPAELSLHRKASMGLLPASLTSFQQTAAWLMAIRNANIKHHAYDAAALDKMLQDVWFRMAMGCVRQGGMNVWRWYRREGTSFLMSKNSRQSWIVLGAACKASSIGRFL